MHTRLLFTMLATTCAIGTIPQSLHAQDSTARTTASASTPSSTPSPAPVAAPRKSWLADRRDLQVGDIITVLVDEFTLASLDKRVDATDNRRRDLSATAATPGNTAAIAIATGNNATSQSRGSDARSNRVATEMSARVVEVGPNGLVRLEGTKTLNVEKSKISLALSGWARTQDVTFNNLIPSSRLADARLEYQAEGPLGTPKGGAIGKLLGKLWP